MPKSVKLVDAFANVIVKPKRQRFRVPVIGSMPVVIGLTELE